MPISHADSTLFEKRVAAAESAFEAIDGFPSMGERRILLGTAIGLLLLIAGFIGSTALGQDNLFEYGLLLLALAIACGIVTGVVAHRRQRNIIYDLREVAPDAVTQAAMNYRARYGIAERDSEARARQARLRRAGLMT